MRLQARRTDGSYESMMLPYEWSADGASKALPRIQQIFKRYVQESTTLAIAGKEADTASSHQKVNWEELIDSFRQQKPQVNERTWLVKYVPVLKRAHVLMNGPKRPLDGHELCSSALERWDHGTRQRQIMRQNLYAFLNWAVQRGFLKAIYLPPADAPETRKPKRVGYALADAQILRLLDDLPQGDTHDRWGFAIQLCAVYGLRPEELRYLRIKDGSKGPELWTTYRKSQGGRKGGRTEPRRLHPLHVRDVDGPVDWNLQSRLQIGEQLPPLGQQGNAGDALGTYLKRKAIWQQLKTEIKALDEELTAYSFRHRYAKQAHSANLPIANIAQAMGHTIEVHLGSYARFKPDATENLFAAVNA